MKINWKTRILWKGRWGNYRQTPFLLQVRSSCCIYMIFYIAEDTKNICKFGSNKERSAESSMLIRRWDHKTRGVWVHLTAVYHATCFKTPGVSLLWLQSPNEMPSESILLASLQILRDVWLISMKRFTEFIWEPTHGRHRMIRNGWNWNWCFSTRTAFRK